MTIDQEVLKGIESRARFLSNRFWHLEYEDLRHDGIAFILDLFNLNPTANSNWFMKSINNFYCNKMREAIKYSKGRALLTPQVEENYPDSSKDVERELCESIDDCEFWDMEVECILKDE